MKNQKKSTKLINICTFLFTISVINTVNANAEVTVAAFKGAEPVVVINDDGSVTGFYPELLRSIFKDKEDISFVTGLSFKDAYSKVMNNEIDLLPAAIRTEERERYFNFNKEPFLVSWSEVFVHPDIYIENIFDLKNKPVALMIEGQNGKNFISLMNSFDIPFKPLFFNSFTEMVDAVYRKEAAALVSFSTFNSDKELKSVGIVFNPTQAYIASSMDGRKDLLDDIDEKLIEYKKNDNSIFYSELNKWFHFQEVVKNPAWIFPVSIIVIIITILFVISVLVLKLKLQKSKYKMLKAENSFDNAIRDAEFNYRTIADYNFDWEFWINPENEFIYCSPSCFEHTGYTADEFRENENLILRIIHPEDKDKWINHTFDYDKSKKSFEGIFKIIHKNGEIRWFEHKCIHIFKDGKFIGHRGSFRNITEKHDLELQLQRSQKLESLGTLTGGIAHDFNNFLTPIIGYSEIIKSRLSPEDPVYGNADKIFQSGIKAKDIISRLLAFSRKQDLKFSFLSVNDLLLKFKAILDSSVKENIELKFDLCPDNPVIFSDAGQLEQIFLNLIVNSRDAMPDGGVIKISTSIADDLSENLFKSVVPDKSGYCLITVEDNGRGMERETLDRAFDPFFSTKKDKGTGLGLSTVYGIIKQQKGYIFAESEIGKGTVFKILFPRHNEEISSTKDDKYNINTEGMSNKTILVAEDDIMVKELIREVIQDSGCSFITADTPIDIINLLKLDSQHIDLLITDIIMPGINGIELYKKAKEIKPDLKVLYISGYSDEIKDNINPEILPNFLKKPFNTRMLLQKIFEILK